MIDEELQNFLKKVPPFQFLEENILNNIKANLSTEFYPRNTIILKQEGKPSEYLQIIKKGGVRVSFLLDNKEEIIIDYRGEGDTFGLWSIVDDREQKTTVTAVDDTICYLLPKKQVLRLLDTNVVFTEYFLKSHLKKYIDNTYTEMMNKNIFYGGTDRILFTTRVGDIAIKNIVSAPEHTTIQDAAGIMVRHKVSSLIISSQDKLPVGIVTDRDLRDRVVAKGRSVSDPVKSIMSLPLMRVDARDYCFEAILKMIRFNIHHILVIQDGELKGVLTNHDLMLLQGGSPLTFAKDIENQEAVEGLVPVSFKVNRVIRLLLKDGARAGNIAKIVSELNDRIVKKVLEIAEKKFGEPPVPYCWIVFGSEGRKEQTFRTDQDNAIIYSNPHSIQEDHEVKRYFSEFTIFVRDSLGKCGVPLCPADYMASNPRWCQPLEIWEKYYSQWIGTPTSEAILKCLIFFDFRALHGDTSLADQLRAYLRRSLKGQKIFFARMAGVITMNRPPLGFFRTFMVDRAGEHKDELNLKFRGIGPIVDLIRFFALEEGVSETSTLERIESLRSIHPIIIELGDEIEQAFEFISLLRIHHQLDQMERNIPPDNFINPGRLTNLEKKSLKESFQVILKIQDAVTEMYRPGMVNR
jgi:CBS domain-containing protein